MADKYADGWNQYKKLKRGYLLTFLGGFILMQVILQSMDLILGWNWAKGLMPIAVIIWIVLSVKAYRRLKKCPCPKCGEPFTKNYILDSRCNHCGLPKYATDVEPGMKS